MPHEQKVMIDALGRMVGEYKDDNPVDFGKFGDQHIVRFSEVLHDQKHQKFYVMYREGAPEMYHGKALTSSDCTASGYGLPALSTTLRESDYPYQCTALFNTYGDAVKAEQAVLKWMMLHGDSNNVKRNGGDYA